MARHLLPQECGASRRRPPQSVNGESCENCSHATDINQGDGTRTGWCKHHEPEEPDEWAEADLHNNHGQPEDVY